MRAAIFYILTLLVVTIYGGEVCPFVAGLSVSTWGMVVAPPFVVGWLLRTIFLKRFLLKFEPLRRPGIQTWYELSWFVVIGIWMGGFNFFAFDYPIGSGLRILVIILSMGFFAAIDLGLNCERDLLKNAGNALARLDLNQHFEPFSRKLILFTFVAIAFVTLEIIMIMETDLPNFSGVAGPEIEAARMTIYREMGVVFLIKLVLLINVVVSLSRNLKLFLLNQTAVLKGVSGGELTNRVPVVSRNEFGLIASYTNEMIDGLNERNQIREAFGKFVSPQIADRILKESPNGIKLGGSRNHVAVLVSDIRSFTTRSEALPPEQIVRELNVYFSKMVAITHDCGGVVDKFLGDGMLCVFGLDDPGNAEKAAAQAGLEMLEAVNEMNQERSEEERIKIGIGIHAGDVVSGKIGSPERLEFTVIGDTVNTASRLEALTKLVGVPILISEAVHTALDQERSKWKSHGDHELRGKKRSMHLYSTE